MKDLFREFDQVFYYLATRNLNSIFYLRVLKKLNKFRKFQYYYSFEIDKSIKLKIFIVKNEYQFIVMIFLKVFELAE